MNESEVLEFLTRVEGAISVIRSDLLENAVESNVQFDEQKTDAGTVDDAVTRVTMSIQREMYRTPEPAIV